MTIFLSKYIRALGREEEHNSYKSRAPQQMIWFHSTKETPHAREGREPILTHLLSDMREIYHARLTLSRRGERSHRESLKAD